MAAHELAFPGHSTLPDIHAYRQFANQSYFPLNSTSRNRKTPIVKGDGIDGRLNPESFFFKSRSAGKLGRKLQLAASSLADGIFEFPNLDVSHNEISKNDEKNYDGEISVNGTETENSYSIQRAVESYMRKNGVRNQLVIDKNQSNEGSFGSLMPEPSLHTWRMTNEIVEMLLEGRITWGQIKSNYRGQEPDQKEIELFCQLSPVQKRTLHFGASKLGFLVSPKRSNTKNEIVDRWGVRRNIDGPFWPLGLGPLGPPPNLRDRSEIWESDKRRQVRDKVLSKLEHLFVKRTSEDGEINATLKQSIVVFDSELSPPMEVRMRKAALLNDEGELIFESRFESGNLRQARRIGTYEYELVLTPDLVTESHLQWFFFQVAGARSGIEYTFRIINFLKTKRLVESGEKLLLYSKKLADKTDNGWTRVGIDTTYGKNYCSDKNPLLKKDTTYYELKWKMVFPFDNDLCVFAHCYPYTYTDLKEDIREIMEKSKMLPSGTVKCEKLCSSFAGNTCFLLTITDPDIQDNQKYAAVITARVHPGETVSSWNMKGLMEFLVHPRNEKAKELRSRYVFKLVPMLNADGVIVGNYRCSLIGRDVNRTYNVFGPDRIPEVHCTRKLVQYCQEICKDVVFCDFHGHSQAHNAFIYGTDSGYRSIPVENITVQPRTYLTNPEQYLIDRMIPFLISKQDPKRFSFRSCRFSLQPWREGCARISLWRRFNLTHCFTMETSLFGTNLEPGSTLRYFDRSDLQNLGQSVALALLDFHEIMIDKVKFSDTLVEMGKSLLHKIMLSKILSKRQMSVVQTRLGNTSKPVNEDLANQISSMADFASAFNEIGDLLEEGDEVESSSASDVSSVADLDFGLGGDKLIVNLSKKPVVRVKRKRRRRRRKHRKCRRRRKNRRRRLIASNNASDNVIKQAKTDEKLKEPMGSVQKSVSSVCLAPTERNAGRGSQKAKNRKRKPSERTVLKLPLREPLLFDLEVPLENQPEIEPTRPIISIEALRQRMQRNIQHN